MKEKMKLLQCLQSGLQIKLKNLLLLLPVLCATKKEFQKFVQFAVNLQNIKLFLQEHINLAFRGE